MSSKQINFFIMPEDWPPIIEFLKEFNAAIIKLPLKEKSNNFIHTVSTEDMNSMMLYLTQPEYIDKISLLPGEKANEFSVDTIESYVIEFNRGGFYPYSSEILHRGRFYIVSSFFDKSGNKVQKSLDFISWSDTLFKEFKKRFLKRPEKQKPLFYSAATLQWMEETNSHVDTSGQKITRK